MALYTRMMCHWTGVTSSGDTHTLYDAGKLLIRTPNMRLDCIRVTHKTWHTSFANAHHRKGRAAPHNTAIAQNNNTSTQAAYLIDP
jgi:hypothetical protein